MKSRTFVGYLRGISASDVNFSNDGQWVTYVAQPEGTLWRSKVDGTDRLQLTFPPLQIDSPHWSPDGRRIAFRMSLAKLPKRIFLIPRDGGVPQKLAALSSGEEEGVPTWSPDGNSLLFGELRWQPDKIAIHVFDLRSRQITTIPGSRGFWTPRWSHDGHRLLALSADPMSPDSQALWIFDFRIRKWKELAKHWVNEPVWSHDGKYIYFDVAADPKEAAIFRVNANSGQLEKIVDLTDFRRAFGNWFGLAPDDSPLLTRDAQH